MIARNVGSANGMGANITASNGWRISSTRWNRVIYFMAWNVLYEMQDHNGSTTTGEMIMKKLFVAAILAITLCLTGLVMSGEAHAQRLVGNGNGTVTDTQTGLMWTKNASQFGERNWNDAMSACSSFSISGIGGWRLPSNNELAALYHAIQGGHPFIGVQSSNYWSSTTNADGDIHAWVVFMGNGHVFSAPKHFTYQAWPVRTAQ